MLIGIYLYYRPCTYYNYTGDLCAGVLKPAKKPTQHFADLKMLSSIPELQPAFTKLVSGIQKEIECVQVDGAGDEAHLEVQFR